MQSLSAFSQNNNGGKTHIDYWGKYTLAGYRKLQNGITNPVGVSFYVDYS